MYNTLYKVDSLPQSGIDLEGVYELQQNDFFRFAGTRWSHVQSTGWFENDIDIRGTSYSIIIDSVNFNGNLDPNVNTLQKLAQAVDDLVLGGSNKYELRHEFVIDSDYYGFAPKDTLDETPIWNLSKIFVTVQGTIVTTHSIDSWDNRLIAIYT